VIRRLRLRRWQWIRGGILAVLAIVAAVLTVVDPHPTATGRDPSDTNRPGSTSVWTQLPNPNDNCADAVNGPPGNAMRLLVGSGVSPDECAGGELWSPVQQAAGLGPAGGLPRG
jgi:hypothetical protein